MREINSGKQACGWVAAERQPLGEAIGRKLADGGADLVEQPLKKKLNLPGFLKRLPFICVSFLALPPSSQYLSPGMAQG
jgi:hypothetical protein